MLFRSKTQEKADPQPTAGFQRVIQRAILHVQSSGKDTVTGANVLVALFSERESNAVFFLQEQEMTRFDAVNYISHGIAKVPGQGESRNPRGTEGGTGEGATGGGAPLTNLPYNATLPNPPARRPVHELSLDKRKGRLKTTQ